MAALAAGASALALGGVAFWTLAQLGREPLAIEVSPAVAVVPLPKPEDRLVLVRSDFSLLPGWADDSVAAAAPAVARSCADKIPRGSAPDAARFGAPAAWLAFCAGWAALPPGDDAAARALIERELVPWAVANRDTREGLLTGYYEPELAGSRKRTSRYRHPLYRDPRDRQVVDLGEFKRDLAGRKITGMVRGGRFRPYWDRKEIERGALTGRSLELLWVDDSVALFFLQIQGSGRVALPDGTFLRVGYDGQNGHDYTAVGRILIERGELTKEAVSLQSIRAWLRAHPERAEELLNQNRSFVFFRLLGGSSPEGASGVELTPGRSLAVDDAFLPYGLPLFLDSTTPAIPELARAEVPLRRLVVAQDTGGAIVGPVRGDLFFGPGREAEELAGRMKQPLRYWLLLPRSVAPAVPAP